jgi:hypothetical protein
MPKHTTYRRKNPKHLGRVPFPVHSPSDQDRHLHSAETFQEIPGEHGIAITLPKSAHDIRGADIAATALPDVNSYDSTCEITEWNRS